VGTLAEILIEQLFAIMEIKNTTLEKEKKQAIENFF
jgi:hypothetical protein